MTQLPRAMLIDMDDTILSAYGRPDIAWNKVAAEFTAEFGSTPSKQVAAAVVEYARKFWATAEAEWRLKLEEARHVVVRGGFAALAAKGHEPLPIGSCGPARRSLSRLSRRGDVRVSGRA